MGTYPESLLPPTHNHPTRDIKPRGECPACDTWWDHEEGRKRIQSRLETCPHCGRLYTDPPGATCKSPGAHYAVPRNHGGTGVPFGESWHTK